MLKKTVFILALGVLAGTPTLAQPMGPMSGPMRDPFGDATVSRKDAEAQATAKFATLDTNHDGVLSPDELAAARPNRPEGGAGRRGGRGGDRMMRMMDTNGDGKITRDEFVAGTLRRFDMMDADHDGQLTKAERQAAFEAMRARMEERMRGMAAGGFGAGGDGSSGGD